MSPVPDEIVLYYEDGQNTGSKTITVEPIPTAEVAGPGPGQATGTSYAFSFEDALDQALTALQGEPSNQPVDATVTTIEASRGGIVPPYIRVTVTRS
jgi:hypothetical protein